MADILTQFSHIFIHYYSNKASSTCKLFLSEPSKNQEEKMGRLFGIFEINTPSRENSQIITQVINIIEESYYSQLEDENLVITTAFEKSLNEANQKFTQLLRERQSYLVGNLNEQTIKEKINLVIGLIKADKVYLTYLNNIGIFLIHQHKQNYKLIDIKRVSVEENGGKTEAGSKIFTNLIEGEVNAPDYLFLANSNFSDYVSSERVVKTITSLPVHKAAEYFKNSLLQFEGHNFAAIIIKNSQLELTGPSPHPSLSSITELNYTESSTEKLLSPSLWSSLGNFTRFIFNSARKNRAAENIAPTENVNSNIAKKSAKFKNIKLGIMAAMRKTFKNLVEKVPLLHENLQRLKNYLRLKLGYFGGNLKKIPNLSKILLVVALLLIILFVYSTSYFKHQQIQNEQNQKFQDLISQIEDQKNQAQASLIAGDEAKAREAILSAQNLLASLNIESQKQRETFQNVNKDVESVIATLRHITNIDEPTLIADLAAADGINSNLQNIVYLANNLYAFDSDSNNGFKINIDSRQINKYASNLTALGKLTKVHVIDNKIIIYHDKNGFVEFKNDTLNTFAVNLQTEGSLIDFASYTGKLYTLDAKTNQIYRHPADQTGYTPGTAWLQDTSLVLKNMVAMAIDTSIWLLGNDGQIFKLNKGRKSSFTIKNLEPALANPTNLFSDDQTKYLYIMEPKNKRVVVLDKVGNLATQYFSQAFDDLKAMAISEKDKKMFLVNGTKIYFAPLTHLK